MRIGILRGLVAVAAVSMTAAASGKPLPPGGLLVCGAQACAPVVSRPAAAAFNRFIYLGRQPAVAPAPALGTRCVPVAVRQ